MYTIWNEEYLGALTEKCVCQSLVMLCLVLYYVLIIQLVLLLKMIDMLKIFRIIALWEAVSTLILFFIAMPIKYILPNFIEVPEEIRMGTVRIAGSIHGFLVVLFVVLLLVCWREYRWKFSKVLTYFFVSLIPIVSFWVEIDLKKEIKALQSSTSHLQ